MSWTSSGIKGYAILASDGTIGTISDFLFDDDSWSVRWLVVSVEAVTGYHINATDGEIGHVETMLVDDADWSIHYLVVDTKN